MTAEPASPERLSEVLRLATALADRALDAQIMGRPVPTEQTIALAKAARLLQDNNVDWPPLLTQVLHELSGNGRQSVAADEAKFVTSQPLPDVDVHGLTRFFAGFRRGEGSSVTTAPMPYTLEQLAPGSYDVLLDGAAMASLVRSLHAACEQQCLTERKQRSWVG